jgi:hypothetical protein
VPALLEHWLADWPFDDLMAFASAVYQEEVRVLRSPEHVRVSHLINRCKWEQQLDLATPAMAHGRAFWERFVADPDVAAEMAPRAFESVIPFDPTLSIYQRRHGSDDGWTIWAPDDEDDFLSHCPLRNSVWPELVAEFPNISRVRGYRTEDPPLRHVAYRGIIEQLASAANRNDREKTEELHAAWQFLQSLE